ncbi:cyclic peptide export ABC transporter [bacterium]|nr:cyclic peptide export ABC transporter [bacterium]
MPYDDLFIRRELPANGRAGQSMGVISFLFGRSWTPLIVAGAAGLGSGLASAGLIAVIGQVLSGSLQADLNLLWIFVPLALTTLVTRVWSQFVLIRVAHQTIFQLRMDLCQRILATPLANLERIGRAPLLAMLTDDVQAVFDAAQVVPYLIVNVVTLVGCLAYMGWISPLGVGLVVLFMGTGALLYYAFQRGAVRSLGKARFWQDRLIDHFHGVTEGAKELQLHAGRRSDYIDQSLRESAREFHRAAIEGMNLYTIAGTWAQLLLVTVLGLFVFAFASWGVTTQGNVAAFGITLLYMARPIDFVLQMLPALGRARVALEKIETLELQLASDSPTTSTTPPLATWSSLELRGVEYTYITDSDEDRFRVGPIDLIFRPGQIVFLIGANGSGKSTLAKLILGLYQPQAGEIRLDGQVITPDRIEWYRRHFTAIFSDLYLFRRLHGLESGHDLSAARDYLRRLHLTEKVRLRDQTLEFPGLSQGQRKRVALLMAYLEDRPIYLFDEWAADQDPHFRDVFYTKLLPELKSRGKLVLIVSHDERYYAAADEVIKIDGGQAVRQNLHQS